LADVASGKGRQTVKRKRVVLRIIPASKAKNQFGEIIRRVYENDEIQIVERAGLPVVGIVSLSDLERLYPEKVKAFPEAATSAKQQRAWRRLHAALDVMHQEGKSLKEEEVEADVLKAVQAVRHGKRKA
jgi:prevent-host-death family protein